MSMRGNSLIDRKKIKKDPQNAAEASISKPLSLPLATQPTQAPTIYPELLLKIGSYLTNANDILAFIWGFASQLFSKESRVQDLKNEIRKKAFETLKSQFPGVVESVRAATSAKKGSTLALESTNDTQDWSFELAYQVHIQKLKEKGITFIEPPDTFLREEFAINNGYPADHTIMRLQFAIERGYHTQEIVNYCTNNGLQPYIPYSIACFAINTEVIQFYQNMRNNSFIHSNHIEDFIQRANAKLGLNEGSLKQLDTNDVRRLTPIHFALVNGDVKKIETLISKLKLDKHITTFKDATGTYLHFAALIGNVGILKFLVKRGLSILEKDGYKTTPFHYAAGYGHLDAVRYFYETARPSKDFLTNVLCHIVSRCARVRGDNTAVIQFLLDKGADPLHALKQVNFTQQKVDITNTHYFGNLSTKEYKENQRNLVNQREQLLIKAYLSQKLNEIFIASDVKKEKNSLTENHNNIYQKTACLFETIAEKGFFDWRGEKAFAKEIATGLRETAQDISPADNNIKNCWDFINDKSTDYVKNGGTMKTFGTLNSLINYIKINLKKILKHSLKLLILKKIKQITLTRLKLISKKINGIISMFNSSYIYLAVIVASIVLLLIKISLKRQNHQKNFS